MNQYKAKKTRKEARREAQNIVRSMATTKFEQNMKIARDKVKFWQMISYTCIVTMLITLWVTYGK